MASLPKLLKSQFLWGKVAKVKLDPPIKEATQTLLLATNMEKDGNINKTQ